MTPTLTYGRWPKTGRRAAHGGTRPGSGSESAMVPLPPPPALHGALAAGPAQTSDYTFEDRTPTRFSSCAH